MIACKVAASLDGESASHQWDRSCAEGGEDTVSTWWGSQAQAEDSRTASPRTWCLPGSLHSGLGFCLLVGVFFFPSFPRLYWNLQSLAWTAGCALSRPSSFSFSFASQFKVGVNLSSKEAEGALDQDTGCLGTDSVLFVCVYVLGQGLGYPRILKLAVNLDMILPFWLSCLQLMSAGIVGRHHHTGFMGYRESNLGPDAC